MFQKTREHILSQIKLCFNPALKLVDCDGIVGLQTEILGNCPIEGITYPNTVRSVPDPDNLNIARQLVLLKDAGDFDDGSQGIAQGGKALKTSSFLSQNKIQLLRLAI